MGDRDVSLYFKKYPIVFETTLEPFSPVFVDGYIKTQVEKVCFK